MTATVATMDAATARRLTGRIRDALALADSLLVQVWEGRGWAALGYASFVDYCRQEIPELQTISLRAPERRRRLEPFVAAGASVGDMAAATGAGRATIHADLQRPELDALRPATTLSADGRRRQARAPRSAAPLSLEEPAPAVPTRRQLVALLRERGPLTAPQIRAALGMVEGSTVSAALCSLAGVGRLTYTPGARRGRHGTYAAPEGTPQ